MSKLMSLAEFMKLTPEQVKTFAKEDKKNKKLESRKISQKKYHEKNKEAREEYHREYQINNPQKISEISKKYYEKNKIRIGIEHKEKYVCNTCDKIMTIHSKIRHEKSKIHLANLIV